MSIGIYFSVLNSNHTGGKIAQNNIKVIYDIPENPESTGYAPDVKLYFSSEKLCKLDWKTTVRMEEAYKDMILYMKHYFMKD